MYERFGSRVNYIGTLHQPAWTPYVSSLAMPVGRMCPRLTNQPLPTHAMMQRINTSVDTLTLTEPTKPAKTCGCMLSADAANINRQPTGRCGMARGTLPTPY